MNVNFPGGAPVVTLRGRLRVVQVIAAPPARGLTIGAAVERGQPLSDQAGGAATLSIALAERLGCSAREVEGLLTKPVGSRFAASEPIANSRAGRRGQSVTAPFAGALRSYNPNSGIGVFVSSDVGASGALASGVVAGLDAEFVTIETTGSRVFGIAGFGRTGEGPIRFISSDPDHVASPSEIADVHRGAVVIAGPWVTAETMRRLGEAQAAAVITGGLVQSEVASACNVPEDEQISVWRDKERLLSTPLSVIATEGFGALPIHPSIWSCFERYQGRDALVIPGGSWLGDLARPQIIVADIADDAAPVPKLHPGAHVRLIDQSSLGESATATSEPITMLDPRGRAIRGIEVRCSNGRAQIVPFSSVELIG